MKTTYKMKRSQIRRRPQNLRWTIKWRCFQKWRWPLRIKLNQKWKWPHKQKWPQKWRRPPQWRQSLKFVFDWINCFDPLVLWCSGALMLQCFDIGGDLRLLCLAWVYVFWYFKALVLWCFNTLMPWFSVLWNGQSCIKEGC